MCTYVCAHMCVHVSTIVIKKSIVGFVRDTWKEFDTKRGQSDIDAAHM